MNVLGIIPARQGSKGCPNKHLRIIDGAPVIYYTITMAGDAETLNHIIISSDGMNIIQYAYELNQSYLGFRTIPMIHRRPKELATDTTPIEDVLRHEVLQYEDETNTSVDIIVWMQADCPIRKAGVIDETVWKLINDEELSSVITIAKAREVYPWRLVIDGDYLYTVDKNSNYRRQDFENCYYADGSVIAMRRKNLFEDLGKFHGYLGFTIGYILQEPPYTLSIDDEWDFSLAKLIIESGEY